MKNKKFIFVIFILAVTLILCNRYFGKTQQVSILQDFNKFTSYDENKKISKEESINVMSKALAILDGFTFDETKHEEALNNIEEPNNFTIKEDGKYELTLNLLTGEILDYMNLQGGIYKETTKTAEQVIAVSDEIIAEFELSAKYECVYAYPFDESLWGMTYKAKYGELYNDKQMIKFYFSPEEKRIYTLTSHGNTKGVVANTEYKISKEKARGIAEKLAKKNNLNVCREKSEIIEANYFWADAKRTENTNVYRLAYVFTCDDDKFTQIYI